MWGGGGGGAAVAFPVLCLCAEKGALISPWVAWILRGGVVGGEGFMSGGGGLVISGGGGLGCFGPVVPGTAAGLQALRLFISICHMAVSCGNCVTCCDHRGHPLRTTTQFGGALSAVRVQCARSARAVQLFGRPAVLETHTLRY